MDWVDRFWAKVDKSGDCWEWTAGLNKGYGRIKINGKTAYAHRLSYVLHHPITIDLWEHSDICVCHKCDNPKCINPAHMFLGSVADNMNDKMAKGRGNALKGENHRLSKLTEHDVREIRKKYADGGISQQQLSLEYEVDRTTIRDIIRRRNWKHI